MASFLSIVKPAVFTGLYPGHTGGEHSVETSMEVADQLGKI